ncbi:YHS domain-containing protein [Nannocystaceae bacterium ST9]
MQLRALLSSAVLVFALGACKKTETTTPDDHHHGDHHGEGHHAEGGGHHDEAKHADFEGREVVVNYAAKPGDVTVCPFSGKKFEVKDDSPRIEWKGQSWVFCCDQCLDKIEADPEKYLGGILEATPPAGEPPAEDPAAGE